MGVVGKRGMKCYNYVKLFKFFKKRIWTTFKKFILK